MNKTIAILTFAAVVTSAAVPARAIQLRPWADLQQRLDAGGDIRLSCDVVAEEGDKTLSVTNSVTLDLAGHTIDAKGKCGVIKITSGGNLTLTNSVPTSGAITGGNAASDDGGGVYVDDGTFTMTGGTISGNAASDDGGGVYVAGGTFTMSRGEISGNTAKYGGGVYVDDGTFAMTGGTISGNTARYSGGGVFVYEDNTFTVSGDPVVSGNTNSVGAANNVYLPPNITFAVSNLTAGASIGVTTWIAPNLGVPLTFATGAGAGDEAHFFSDVSDFGVDRENGALRLYLLPSPQWAQLQAQLDAGGRVTLTNDVTATASDLPLAVTNAVTLDLNGHTIDAAGWFEVIIIYPDGHLTLTNGSESAGVLTGGSSFNVGGGVYVAGGTFTMTGGEISGNTAYYCGGVYVSGDGTFTMTGGTISGNTAYSGGGVEVDWGTFTVSGSPVVSGNTNSVGAANNVYLYSGRTIAVDGLSDGARIGVTTETAPTETVPVTFTAGASEGDDKYFFSDNPGSHVERDGGELLLVPGAGEKTFWDPEGRLIEDYAVVKWLSENGFTQADIDGLGSDSAATDRLYECWLLNCSITAANRGGALSITGFAVSTNHVSMTVQLVRHFPLGAINGELHLYGADDLSVGFGDSPIAGKSIDFGDGDSTFDTGYVAGPLTQSVTATFDARDVSYKFFKTKIEFPISEVQEE